MVLGIFCMGFSYAFLRSLINSPEFVKSNYRNASIPSLGGLVVLLSLIISGLVINLLPETQVPKKLDMSTLIIILGFAFIGLLDDLLGDKAKQGFKGHISELFKGRLTTGSLKLFGGPAIVLLSLSNNISSDGYFNIFIDVICISHHGTDNIFVTSQIAGRINDGISTPVLFFVNKPSPLPMKLVK